ncbi:MAG: hypothetical protein K9I95_06005 [Flavobacteriaceae bacterium]|jgi:5-bromo-4-chloroindolyl phosphate hydrolysis protein|nr:hypothetical protein [Flavobacteriaceae bacterium]
MHFENSLYSKEFKYLKVGLSFGNFYFCEYFFISEIHQGEHFDWPKVMLVAKEIFKHYGLNAKLGYISNRIYSYSSEPQSWDKIEKKYGIIVASAIVYYNDFTYKNASLEKMFSQKSIKRCMSLDEAIIWMKTLKEFN